ncbi:hypothetical protein RV15_GL002175 [Enterococcus silesiacus]|nr:hypothetical protein RV15_GL002175 [Enterococcus silesiacus]
MYQQKKTAFFTKKKERLTKKIQTLMGDLKNEIEANSHE